MRIRGIWNITSMYLMFSMTTMLNLNLILHIAGIFTEALSFHTWKCISEKPILKVLLGLSLTLQYWLLLCRSVKTASFKYYNKTSHRMHGNCCQLVFVIDVNLGYIHYLVDFYYCFQFTACYFVVYRIKLMYNIYFHVWHTYILRQFAFHHFGVSR